MMYETGDYQEPQLDKDILKNHLRSLKAKRRSIETRLKLLAKRYIGGIYAEGNVKTKKEKDERRTLKGKMSQPELKRFVT